MVEVKAQEIVEFSKCGVVVVHNGNLCNLSNADSMPNIMVHDFIFI